MLILEVLMYSNKAESSSSENSNSREDISAFSLSVKILGTPARHNQQINAFQKSSFFFFLISSTPPHKPKQYGCYNGQMGKKHIMLTMFSKAKGFNESTSSLLNHFASHSFEHTFLKLIASPMKR